MNCRKLMCSRQIIYFKLEMRTPVKQITFLASIFHSHAQETKWCDQKVASPNSFTEGRRDLLGELNP